MLRDGTGPHKARGRSRSYVGGLARCALARPIARRLLPLLAAPLGLALLLVSLSPPWAGREVAARLGVPYPAVVAHRGASAWAPEETVPAYELALALGVDYLELDLQRSRDGTLLAMHDESVARTTDAAAVFPGREAEPVDRFTWEELRRLDAGSWFNAARPARARERFRGVRIASLAEILDVAERAGPGGPGLYIETKAPERFPGIEAELVAALRARGWLGPASGGPARVIFQSFSPESLDVLRDLAPSAPRVLLISAAMVDERGFEHWLSVATALDAGLGPVGTRLYPWRVGAAHRAGRLVHPYTLNRPWQMGLARVFGVDGMFTDEPGLLLEQLGRSSGTDPAAALEALGW